MCGQQEARNLHDFYAVADTHVHDTAANTQGCNTAAIAVLGTHCDNGPDGSGKTPS